MCVPGLRFHQTQLEGAWLIEPERHYDVRGAFARVFCTSEFATHSIDCRIAQCSISFNSISGTLRGIHFQGQPHRETKLVRVQRGAIWDVIVDLRRNSVTFASWYGTELSAENALALYVPEGFGHGFITLVDDTEVFYQISVPYVPHLARGIRWNDPAISIAWPIEPVVISDKDCELPLLVEALD